jgi:hypothetical protein
MGLKLPGKKPVLEFNFFTGSASGVTVTENSYLTGFIKRTDETGPPRNAA